MAGKLPVPALTRAWQMLLKGLIEVRDATRPIAACEMALIRLSHAADLPPTDKLVRDLLDNSAGSSPSLSPGIGGKGKGEGARPRTVGPLTPTLSPKVGEREAAMQARAPALSMAADSAPAIRTLEDIVALAAANGASILKVNLENDVHLVRLEPGQIEFRPSPRAPKTLAGDLKQKLRDWTGVPWSVSIAREGGAPTLAEQKKSAKAARFESVMQEPLVRAVLDRFPGAEIVAVRDTVVEEAVAEAAPETSDE
jgi:DNA polymerase-3 subunit gamma/tau